MLTLDSILAVLAALVGWPALVALAVDILKYFGVVTDTNAGKWSLGFNLAGFAIVAILLGFFPQVDIPGWDAVLLNYVTIAGYIVTLLLQMGSTKMFHALYKKSDAYNKRFSYSAPYSLLTPQY